MVYDGNLLEMIAVSQSGTKNFIQEYRLDLWPRPGEN